MSANEVTISSSIPPLISNSPPPPPSSTSLNQSPSTSALVESDNDDDNDNDDLPNLYDAIQIEPVRSLNDPDPDDKNDHPRPDNLDAYHDLPEVPSHVHLEEVKPDLSVTNETSNFATDDWDPFNAPKPANEADSPETDTNKNASDDWANFGATESYFETFANSTTAAVVDQTSLNLIAETSEPKEVSSNTNLNVQVNDDDDDEFSEFVDNSDCIQAEVAPTTEPPSSRLVEQPPKQVANEFVAPPPKAIAEPALDMCAIVDRIFSSPTDNNSFFKSNTASHEATEDDEYYLDVRSNPTWLELKTYTSINDASLSLKFKWYLSTLENFYLESLNLERASIPVKVSYFLPLIALKKNINKSKLRFQKIEKTNAKFLVQYNIATG
jgi:hypothetical protein